MAELRIIALRDAIREELDATSTYDKLRELFPERADIIDEIKNDEINHTGRLMNILFELEPSEVEHFNAGLEQREST